MFLQTENAPYTESSYLENQATTASREELIMMLYDGAIRFSNQGRQDLQAQAWPSMNWNLLRAQRIVHYLSLCLNMKEGGEIAKNLDRLYEFVNRRLCDANLKRHEDGIEDALKILRTLRNAWKEGLLPAEGS